MVKEYGMSRQLGQVYFSRNKQNPFLNANPDSGGDYSEMTAHLIDEEIRQIIDEQYERVLGILKSRRDILDEAAKKLLESEVIEGEELKALADAVSQSGRSEDDTKNSQNSPALAA
jgi:cell division protease FtsH